MLHISDLHFGRVDPAAIECLEQFLLRQDKKIDLIVVTGDWTQRARRREFQAAAEFIKKLPAPVVSVPGNHDIPLYDIIKRMTGPLDRYEKYIVPLTADIFENEDLLVVGLTTPHRSRSVEGKISGKQLNRVAEIFEKSGKRKIKIIACHHPVFYDKEESQLKPAYRVESLLALDPDMILSGHFHINAMEQIQDDKGHSVLHLSAGSAISNRLRGEANSFNMIELKDLNLNIVNFALDQDTFTEVKRAHIQLPLRN